MTEEQKQLKQRREAALEKYKGLARDYLTSEKSGTSWKAGFLAGMDLGFIEAMKIMDPHGKWGWKADTACAEIKNELGML